MLRFGLFSIMIVSLLLSGCSRGLIAGTPASATQEPTTSLILPGETLPGIAPTTTSLIKTSIPPTRTITSQDVSFQQILIEDVVPNFDPLIGALVIEDYSNGYGYIYDLLTQSLIPLNCESGIKSIEPNFGKFVVSPTGDRMACIENLYPGSKLVVVTRTGEVVHELVLPKNYQAWYITGWISDNELILQTELPGEIMICDFSTGEIKELISKIPIHTTDGDIYPYNPFSDDPSISYNDNFTFAILTRYPRDGSGYKAIFELWDTAHQKSIWKIEVMLPFRGRPIWSDDGSSILLMYYPYMTDLTNFDYAENLYKVGLDGQVKLLMGKVIGGFTQSPDRNYLAAWWRSPTSGACGGWKHPLAIYSVITQRISVYCFQNSGETLAAGQFPVWSPDGRYIVFNQQLEDGDDSQIVLFDTKEKIAFSLLQGYLIKGWIQGNAPNNVSSLSK